MLRDVVRGFVVLAFVTVAVFSVAVPMRPAVGQSITLISEDFEGAWPGSWIVSDQNLGNGADYWGVSSYRARGGSQSAWAAEVGANAVFGGQPNRDVHYYDDNMQAWMEQSFTNPGAVEGIRLTFWMWQESESCCDPFVVAEYVGFWNTIWGYAGFSGGWQQVTLSLSGSASGIRFIFLTDGSVIYEGVYIDDLEIVAESGPPTTDVLPLPAYTSWSDFPISFAAWDNGSGVDYIELYFRFEGGAWTLYTPSWNPTGQWAPWFPIWFNTSANGDGLYEFYTIGTDNVGNVEGAPPIADASTTVDTIAPISSVAALPEYTNDRTFSVPVNGADAGGIARIDVYMRRDLETWSWFGYLTAQPWSLAFVAPTDGLYEFYSVAVDRAGHLEAGVGLADAWVLVDTTPPELEIVAPQVGGRYVSNDVVVAWDGFDTGSGIVRYEVRIDEGAWEDHGTETSMTVRLSDGNHVIAVRAYDRAGNVRMQVAEITVDANPLSPSGPLGGAPLYVLLLALAVAFLLVGLWLWRRRGARKATPSPPAPPG